MKTVRPCTWDRREDVYPRYLAYVADSIRKWLAGLLTAKNSATKSFITEGRTQL
jgi:hypothetical protein